MLAAFHSLLRPAAWRPAADPAAPQQRTAAPGHTGAAARAALGRAVRVTQLHVHAVKGCAGVAVPEAAVGPRGLRWDREWAVFRRAGGCAVVTQRDIGAMKLIKAEVRPRRAETTGGTGGGVGGAKQKAKGPSATPNAAGTPATAPPGGAGGGGGWELVLSTLEGAAVPAAPLVVPLGPAGESLDWTGEGSAAATGCEDAGAGLAAKGLPAMEAAALDPQFVADGDAAAADRERDAAVATALATRRPIRVHVWGVFGTALPESPAAAEWLSRVLGAPVFLGRALAPRRPGVEGGNAPAVEHKAAEAAFQDCTPLQMLTEEALGFVRAEMAALERASRSAAEGAAPASRAAAAGAAGAAADADGAGASSPALILGRRVDATQFRPNIVVAGCPFPEEDHWAVLSAAAERLRLRCVMPTGRCSVPTLLPDGSRPADRQPTRMLKERHGGALAHRPASTNGYLGVSLTVEVLGGAAGPADAWDAAPVLRVGDAISVAALRAEAPIAPPVAPKPQQPPKRARSS